MGSLCEVLEVANSPFFTHRFAALLSKYGGKKASYKGAAPPADDAVL